MTRLVTWICGCLLGAATLAVEAGTLVQFRTVLGDLDVELYDAEKPVTVRNFTRYVQSGAYQNTFLHRAVPGFVVQGGGFYTVNRSGTALFAPPWGWVGVVPSFGKITNEFNVGPLLSNTNGTIAMAKEGSDPNSASSQWFFNLGNNSTNLNNQNGGFTVFGRVVRDTGGVLNHFRNISYANGVVDMRWWYPSDGGAAIFSDLPVAYYGFSHPRYLDLFYVDISLLDVSVTLSNGVRRISWNSVSGKANVVEYTAAMPPVWQTLVSTNGNGTRFTVTDATTTNAFRFYRVRVNY